MSSTVVNVLQFKILEMAKSTSLLYLAAFCSMASLLGATRNLSSDHAAPLSPSLPQPGRQLTQAGSSSIKRGVSPLLGEDAATQNNLDTSLPVFHNDTGAQAPSTASRIAGIESASAQISDGCDDNTPATGPGGAAGANVPPGATTNSIDYHTPGQVLRGTVHTYVIYYGSFNSTAKTLIQHFLTYVGSSNWYGINTLYGDTTGFVNQSSTFVRAYQVVGTPFGTSIGDADVEAIIEQAIVGGGLGPRDTNAVYYLLTAANIIQTSGFCQFYCGYHSYYTGAGGSKIKYAFVGNPEQCYGACASSPTGTLTPNGVKGIDAMISIVAHEFVEAISDPYLDAWYDMNGNENADKCAYVYGPTSAAANGAASNILLPNNSTGKRFLIQQNWVNANGGYCGMSKPTAV
ncbi:hypothetical protein WJX72_002993 [[Myrmecia] bisecta]|uniref:Phosphate-induced protein 1 conserved region-domain-containing protein n=1 Tax=[Myrmecia] bisecta TaxID=41462 RepID=A0AAW1Q1A9_9CHLO